METFKWALETFKWALETFKWALETFKWALETFKWALETFKWALETFTWAQEKKNTIFRFPYKDRYCGQYVDFNLISEHRKLLRGHRKRKCLFLGSHIMIDTVASMLTANL